MKSINNPILRHIKGLERINFINKTSAEAIKASAGEQMREPNLSTNSQHGETRIVSINIVNENLSLDWDKITSERVNSVLENYNNKQTILSEVQLLLRDEPEVAKRINYKETKNGPAGTARYTTVEFEFEGKHYSLIFDSDGRVPDLEFEHITEVSGESDSDERIQSIIDEIVNSYNNGDRNEEDVRRKLNNIKSKINYRETTDVINNQLIIEFEFKGKKYSLYYTLWQRNASHVDLDNINLDNFPHL